MKTHTIIGVLLIVLGVAAFVYQGVSWTTREKAIDLGPVQVTAEKKHTLPLPPLIGGALAIGGVAVLLVGAKKS